MLQKNGIDLKKLCEFSRPTSDVRIKIDWNKTLNKRFIQFYSYSAFPVEPISTDFLNNNISFSNIAPIGTRPNLNLRFSATTPGQYYLIKFSDNSVRLTTNNIPYTATPEGTIIGTAEENLKFLILEMVGGGGGGAGGGDIFAGAGGAGGGYILGLLNLEHDAGANWKKNSIPLQVGAGGAGVRDRKQAGDGQDTGFYINSSLALSASGGDGAGRDNPGSYREVAIAGVDSIFYAFYSLNGNDGAMYGNSIEGATSPATGPKSENVLIQYPSVSASSGFGGSGGCSRLAGGGDANRTPGKNGGDGKGPGAGGGGGSAAPVSTGGNGANGLINFYY